MKKAILIISAAAATISIAAMFLMAEVRKMNETFISEEHQFVEL